MIGICIKYFHENYGGMLQAYATITKLKEMGLEYEIIQYEKHHSIWNKIKQLPRLFNGVLLNDKKELLKKKIGRKIHSDFATNDNIRSKAFAKFREEKFTHLSPIFRGYNNLCKGTKKYSAIATGSDQLWSPAGLPTNFYNLMFVSDEIKKISIASSFGVKSIPWYQLKRTRQYLDRIEFISMREQRGCEIVKELTGREVSLILDPVFFFDKNGWEELIPKQTIYSESYIFAYLLGNTPLYRQAIEKVAKKLKCKIVTFRHLDQYVKCDEHFGDYAPYNVSPSDFLNILRGAKFICTDSFHGSVFSIIHQKQFIVFNRYDENAKYSKNSRIDTLCNSLGLNNRRFKSTETLCEQIISPIDYSVIIDKLNLLRRKSDEYLKTAFEGIK